MHERRTKRKENFFDSTSKKAGSNQVARWGKSRAKVMWVRPRHYTDSPIELRKAERQGSDIWQLYLRRIHVATRMMLFSNMTELKETVADWRNL